MKTRTMLMKSRNMFSIKKQMIYIPKFEFGDLGFGDLGFGDFLRTFYKYFDHSCQTP